MTKRSQTSRSKFQASGADFTGGGPTRFHEGTLHVAAMAPDMWQELREIRQVSNDTAQAVGRIEAQLPYLATVDLTRKEIRSLEDKITKAETFLEDSAKHSDLIYLRSKVDGLCTKGFIVSTAIATTFSTVGLFLAIGSPKEFLMLMIEVFR